MIAAPPQTLWVRDIGSNVDDAKHTFSSWDACMNKAYCKWPVIIAIIVVSLIVISIVTCVVRCCCCGLECCCGCFRCFNSCCPSPRGGNKRSKYADGPPPGFQPSPYQGYQSQPPPSYGPGRTYNEPAKFATFESSSRTGGKVGAHNEDALPAMPSWDQASTRRVEDTSHHEEVEMDHLSADAEQKAPMLAHQPASPLDHNGAYGAAVAAPYQDRVARNGGDLGNPYGQNNYGGAAVTGHPRHDLQQHSPYGTQPAAYGASHNPYGSSSPRAQHGYNGTTYGVMDEGHSSPPPHNNPYGQTGHIQQQYGASSPPAQPTGGIPASLVPARGATPQAPQQQQGYQSYSAYGPSESSSAYTSYAPSSQSHTMGAGPPPMRQPAQQHSDSWRDV